MGYGRWRSEEYKCSSNAVAATPRHELFHRSSKSCDPRAGQRINIEEITMRESRDSEANPLSTPIIVGLDVTGSMGIIPEKLVKKGLGVFVEQTLQQKPVTDPHICFLGIGDATQRDQAPLQATQFESDNAVFDQLTDIWLEGGGGGNHFESYDLAWAFAVGKCSTDAWEKRQTKGFLFTVGDEEFPQKCNASFVRDRVHGDVGDDVSPVQLLELARKQYHVFHVVIAQGSYASRDLERTVGSWREHLDKRVLVLDDYDALPQLLVAAMAVEAGDDVQDVLNRFDDGVAATVGRAIGQ
jgi:hypothetical protein